jgi:hypothetical protein
VPVATLFGGASQTVPGPDRSGDSAAADRQAAERCGDVCARHRYWRGRAAVPDRRATARRRSCRRPHRARAGRAKHRPGAGRRRADRPGNGSGRDDPLGARRPCDPRRRRLPGRDRARRDGGAGRKVGAVRAEADLRRHRLWLHRAGRGAGERRQRGRAVRRETEGGACADPGRRRMHMERSGSARPDACGTAASS